MSVRRMNHFPSVCDLRLTEDHAKAKHESEPSGATPCDLLTAHAARGGASIAARCRRSEGKPPREALWVFSLGSFN
jgi:hypothetical protein